jgi:two-component system nitrate/nitrite sensor histidine kinase NarX
MPRQPLQDCLASIAGEFAVEGKPGVELATNIKAPLYLPPDQLEQVQRVVREGLLNASRHAQARQITVRLAAEGKDITIILEDDGRGFDPEAQRGDHFGLSIMRARAARIGGRVEIDSAPGRGTRVIFNWPRDSVSRPQVDQTSKESNRSGQAPANSNQ